MSLNTNTKNAPDYSRQDKRNELSKRWPYWEFYFQMMGCPPLEVMDWLCELREHLGSVEKFEMSIACGGFHIKTTENCACAPPMSEAEAMDAYRSAHKQWDKGWRIRARNAHAPRRIYRIGQEFVRAHLTTYGDMPYGCEAQRQMRQLLHCAAASVHDTEPAEALGWLHANHRLYNRAIKHLIASTIGLNVLKGILERDLVITDSDLGVEWGNLFPKDYTRQLLDHFVDSDDWC